MISPTSSLSVCFNHRTNNYVVCREGLSFYLIDKEELKQSKSFFCFLFLVQVVVRPTLTILTCIPFPLLFLHIIVILPDWLSHNRTR